MPEKKECVTDIIVDTVEIVCSELCKYYETIDDGNYICDYVRQHGSCPLDRLY